MYEAKTARISNFLTFWPIIQLIIHNCHQLNCEQECQKLLVCAVAQQVSLRLTFMPISSGMCPRQEDVKMTSPFPCDIQFCHVFIISPLLKMGCTNHASPLKFFVCVCVCLCVPVCVIWQKIMVGYKNKVGVLAKYA